MPLQIDPIAVGVHLLLGLHRAEHAADRSPRSEVVEKIPWEHELLGHSRFLAQMGLGGVPREETLRSMELLTPEVFPKVREAVR